MHLNKTDVSILIVEDDDDTRFLLQRIFDTKGYRVTCALGIQDATRILSDDPPHLVLLDISLQDGTGFDLISDIRRNGSLKELPVVVLSNHSETNMITTAITLGANDYLVKPINAATIMARIEKFIEPILSTRGHTVIFKETGDELNATARFKVNISKLGENGTAVVSNIYFKNGIDISLKSKLFDDMGINILPKRLIKTQAQEDKLSKTFSNRRYESYIAFIGVSDLVNKSIRKFINKFLTQKGFIK